MNLSVKEQRLYITYTAVFLSFTLKFERVCFTGDYSQWKKKIKDGNYNSFNRENADTELLYLDHFVTNALNYFFSEVNKT